MKMLHSIRGTASPALAALKHLRATNAPLLSIRRWAREGRGVLFLPYDAAQKVPAAGRTRHLGSRRSKSHRTTYSKWQTS